MRRRRRGCGLRRHGWRALQPCAWVTYMVMRNGSRNERRAHKNVQRTSRHAYPKVSKVMNHEVQAAQVAQTAQAATINILPQSQTELPSLIVLASQSPRRKELLLRAGISTYCIPSDINETKRAQEAPKTLVERLAREKLFYVYDHFSELMTANTRANAHAKARTNAQTKAEAALRTQLSPDPDKNFFLAADTIVWTEAGQVLGKPKDAADAKRKLALLSDAKHHVSTAVYMRYQGISHSLIETTDVWFYPLSAQEIEAYVLSKDPMDKAGAYGIQGGAALFVEKISGNYENVVGLPLAHAMRAIRKLWQEGNRPK